MTTICLCLQATDTDKPLKNKKSSRSHRIKLQWNYFDFEPFTSAWDKQTGQIPLLLWIRTWIIATPFIACYIFSISMSSSPHKFSSQFTLNQNLELLMNELDTYMYNKLNGRLIDIIIVTSLLFWKVSLHKAIINNHLAHCLFSD